MIKLGSEKVYDIVFRSNTIYKAVFNNYIVYEKLFKLIGAEHINIGDSSEYKYIINGIEHNNVEITCDNPNIMITGNKVFFNCSEGDYTLTVKYNHIENNINVNVKDINIYLIN